MFAKRFRTFIFSLVWLLAIFSPALLAEDLPQQISDSAFWEMISEFSEPGGYFRSDNFVSNETTFQYVIPALQKSIKPGGVYLGVGPDQNFTYIVALRPKIAFIVDIRRQNMLQHLMYKAIIELSADRAGFLSYLFSRKRPADLASGATPEELFAAYAGASADRALFEANLSAIRSQLIEHHGFTLDAEDQQGIASVYEAFFLAGPDITYSFPNGTTGRGMPRYSDLMIQTDGQQNRSYMANEENFQFLKQIEEKNLIVPLVGDFGGDKALHKVGDYLKEHNATLTAMYTSNVEQYLFDSDAWLRFYPNMETLPIDSTSTFIRSSFNTPGSRVQGTIRSTTLLCSMESQLRAFDEGQIVTYVDVLRMSNLP